MLDLQLIHGKLNRGKAIEVGRDDDIRYVAVHEDFAGLQAADLIGRHPTVRASDPHVPWTLLLHQPAEESRTVVFRAQCPLTISFEQI
jgi:hypothetical protein